MRSECRMKQHQRIPEISQVFMAKLLTLRFRCCLARCRSLLDEQTGKEIWVEEIFWSAEEKTTPNTACFGGTLSPRIMDVEKWLCLKGNYYWKDPFLISMIMGGSVVVFQQVQFRPLIFFRNLCILASLIFESLVALTGQPAPVEPYFFPNNSFFKAFHEKS